METKFNFKSQVCTSLEQSERLLTLGLKKETADMVYTYEREEHGDYYYWNLEVLEGPWDSFIWPSTCTYIPAWSLHRLIEMMPYLVEVHNKTWTLEVSKDFVRYGMVGKEKAYVGFIQRPNTYDAIIDCIEWLITEGEFEKEYLEE